MRQGNMGKMLRFVAGPFLVLFIWFLVERFHLIDTFFLPAPLQVAQELVHLIVSRDILPDLAITIIRVGISFLLACMLGIPLGLLLGSSKYLYDMFECVIDFFRSIPATAMFPLFILVFGIGDQSKIAVTACSSALIIIFNTAYGVINAKKLRKVAAHLMGASKMHIFRLISFWESLPQTFVGIRTAMSLSLIVVVVTEMFIGTYAGLGKKIVDFQYIYDVKGMYAVILLTGIIGYALNFLIIYLERRMIHWSGK